MRIAFIWPSGAPWNGSMVERGLGGSKMMMTLYAEEFARRGHEVYCFSPSDTALTINGVAWLQLPASGTYDVAVSIRSPYPLQDVSARHKVFLANDQLCQDLPLAVKRGFVSDIFCISRFQFWRYRELYPEIPAEMFYETSAGVDWAAYKNNLPRDRSLCLYLSTPERGLRTLLKLWPEIVKECPYARLEITSGFQLYGYSDEKAWELSQGLYENLPRNVRYLGPLPRSALLSKQQSAGMMIYPTNYLEMCCIAALEAHCAELAIVASDVGALSERVWHLKDGILVPPNDDGEFIRSAVWLLQNTFAQEAYGKSGREHVQRYSYPVLVSEWLQRLA